VSVRRSRRLFRSSQLMARFTVLDIGPVSDLGVVQFSYTVAVVIKSWLVTVVVPPLREWSR
jgi:hypothetical protein